MDAETAAKLRKPFPPEAIGKLPRGGTKLDFVGHAAVTDRLLSVDPEWNWEPLAVDAVGLPARDAEGSLWIKLTVGGVTRLGVSDPNDTNKVAIGDAIRNAAMRFGVALDLWSKDDLESQVGQSPRKTTRASRPQPDPATPGEHAHLAKIADITRTVAAWGETDPRRAELHRLRAERGWPIRVGDYDRATAAEVWNTVRDMNDGLAPQQSDQEIPGATPGTTVPADPETSQGVLEVGQTEQEVAQRNGGVVPGHQPAPDCDGPTVGAPPKKKPAKKS